LRSPTHPGIGDEALAEFAKAVWTAFPDFHIELLNAGEIEPGANGSSLIVKKTGLVGDVLNLVLETAIHDCSFP
jgi:hypothetical protein